MTTTAEACTCGVLRDDCWGHFPCGCTVRWHATRIEHHTHPDGEHSMSIEEYAELHRDGCGKATTVRAGHLCHQMIAPATVCCCECCNGRCPDPAGAYGVPTVEQGSA